MTQTNQQTDHSEQTPQGKRSTNPIWKWTKRIGQVVLFLLIFLVGLIHQSDFQKWAAEKATVYFSRELNTTVRVDMLEFSLFGGAGLKGFYMEDLRGDTMIVAENLFVDLESGLWTLFQNKINIDAIGLTDARLIIHKDSAAARSNIESVFDQLSSNEKKSDTQQGTPLTLSLNYLSLNDVQFLQKDLTKGQEIDAIIGKGEIDIKTFDLENELFVFKDVYLLNPVVRLTNYPKYPYLETINDSDSLPNIKEELIAQDAQVLVGKIQCFALENGQFYLDNYRAAPVKITPDDQMDFNHLGVYDINISINDFVYEDWDFKGAVQQITAKTTSGFVLENLSAQQAHVGCEILELYDLNIKTPQSTVGDTLVFKYRSYSDWLEFTDKVRMNLNIKKSRVALKDVMAFSPPLQRNIFFQNNRKEIFQIDGQVKGRVNRLDARDLTLELPNRLSLKGEFSSRDLTILDEAIMNFDLQRLKTSIATLRQLIPGFTPPGNFNKLTNLDFTGKFDGFFVDFVADGRLKTNLGNAEVNMRMDLKDGRQDAKYSGELTLKSFDLGQWSGSDDLGMVSFSSSVKKGQGLTIETASALLSANIDSLEFRGYDYQNVDISGQLNQAFFNGDLAIDDANIKLNFSGAIDYRDSLPSFNFGASVDRLNLMALNLSKTPFSIAGDFDLQLTDADLNNLQGDAVVENLVLTNKDEEDFKIDSIALHSEALFDNNKRFRINSDILQLEILGKFDIEKIPFTISQFFARNYPAFSGELGLMQDSAYIDSSAFAFDLAIFDTKNLTRLIDPAFDYLLGGNLIGEYDGIEDNLLFELDIDSFAYDNAVLRDIVIMTKMKQQQTSFSAAVYNAAIGEKIDLSPVTALGLINQDTIDIGLQSFNLPGSANGVFDNLNLNLSFFLDEMKGLVVRFADSELTILDEQWKIKKDNFIRIGKKKIQTRDFSIVNRDRLISLNSIDENGLELFIKNMDIGFVNDFIRDSTLYYNGRADLTASVGNLFEMQNLRTSLSIDTFLINGDDWGVFRFDAETAGLETPLDAYLIWTQGEYNTQIVAEGKYNQPTVPLKKGQPIPKNYFDFQVGIVNFPISFLEYLLSTSIRETTGTVDGDVRFEGTPDELNLNGTLEVNRVATTVNFLNTRYFVEKEKVQVDNRNIRIVDGRVTDELGNLASIQGGLQHDRLTDFRLAVSLTTLGETFLALNTTEELNSTFYGRGMGRGRVRFDGPFRLVNATIDATTTTGTNIVIPVSSSTEAKEERFILFEEDIEDDDTPEEDGPRITGLNLEMNLQMTRAADVALIFDRKWGDVIRGNGEGNLNIQMGTNGDFEMRGTYIINQGNYLFTLMKIGVNKPFEVASGGTIRWDGDPFNATIDISAQYENLSASTYNFIQELLVSAPQTVIDASRVSTPVELTMNLTGNLYNPNISFDIDFPTLPPELKGYTEGKLRTVRQDQNELNRQVFGLLISGQFLPTGGNIQAADIGINTLSEMIASQFSIYVTELVSEWLTEDGLISGIDFDFSLSRYSVTGISDATELTQSGNEFQGRMRLLFRNDRLIFHAGTNVDWGNTATLNTGVPTNNNQLTGEFMLEYILTEDRKFRVRVYQRSEPDISGRQNKYGLGFSFRREFDSFEELFSE